MKLLFIFLIIFFGIAIGATIISGLSADPNYDSSTKSNSVRLTLIYLVLALVLAAGLAFYIF